MIIISFLDLLYYNYSKQSLGSYLGPYAIPLKSPSWVRNAQVPRAEARKVIEDL